MGFFKRLLFNQYGPTQDGKINKELTLNVFKYCEFCGQKLVVRTYLTNFYDKTTGKRKEKHILECRVDPCRHTGCFYLNDNNLKIRTRDINCIRCGRNKYDS